MKIRRRKLGVIYQFAETLLMLWLVLPSDPPRNNDIDAQSVAVSEHLCLCLLRTDVSDLTGTRAFFSWYYDETWSPTGTASFARPGDAVGIAFLSPRSVEATPGPSPEQETRWPHTAERLMSFVLTHAYDPARGVLRGDKLSVTGTRLGESATW